MLAFTLACSRVGTEKSILHEESNQVKICAKVNSIKRVYPLQGTQGRLRWLIHITVIKNVHSQSTKMPALGEELQIVLHSPSRDFGSSPSESDNKIFLVNLVSLDDRWSFLNAKKDRDVCPDL
jgi:hypothetical protein